MNPAPVCHFCKINDAMVEDTFIVLPVLCYPCEKTIMEDIAREKKERAASKKYIRGRECTCGAKKKNGFAHCYLCWLDLLPS